MASLERTIATILLLAGAGALTWSNLELRSELRSASTELNGRLQNLETQSKSVLGEVTRIRIEQRSDKKGPEALLEKLRTYAPLAASSRTTQPDFTMATEEMEATLRAFAAIGKDAYAPIAARFRSLDPSKDYDEMKQLMRAAVRADPDAGAKLVVSIVQGGTDVKPSPRLRFAAAELLLTIDQPLAQSLLRRIVLAESWRGRDPERAAAHELPALATQSIASSGFSTFIIHYMRSQDPNTEDTLLQILNRSDNDVPSVQEMIEWLGEHRSTRADQRIEELYHKPPGAADNAIFLNKCLDAIDKIRGPAARPFFEAEVAKANNKLVLDHLQWLLNRKG
jgi:hypothetical protein